MFFLRHDLTVAPGEPQSKPQLTGWDLKEVLDPLDGGSSTREDVAAPVMLPPTKRDSGQGVESKPHGNRKDRGLPEGLPIPGPIPACPVAAQNRELEVQT